MVARGGGQRTHSYSGTRRVLVVVCCGFLGVLCERDDNGSRRMLMLMTNKHDEVKPCVDQSGTGVHIFRRGMSSLIGG